MHAFDEVDALIGCVNSNGNHWLGMVVMLGDEARQIQREIM